MKPYMTLMAVVMLISTVEASLSLDIGVQSQFTAGEIISFNYSITSDADVEVNYVVSVSCPDTPAPLLRVKTIDLKGNLSSIRSYTYLTVDESFEPQTCTAFVSIIEPSELTEEESFEIATNPSLSFELYLCMDQACEEKTKTFAIDEDVYIEYSSGVSNPVINATLSYPNGTSQEITLPYSMKAEQTGLYTLEVTASKESYKNVSDSISFAVIERHANITDASECNADGTCDPEETYQTCPQDCASGQLDGICDLVEDEICDPDCNGTRDEDCRIDYEVPMDEGWNLISFPLERLQGISAFILPLFFLLGILVWRIYI